MKKSNLITILMILTPLFALLTSSRCSHDPDTLVVSPNTLELLSEKGSSVSFTINTNTDWEIYGLPEWLSASAQSGISNGVITLTALSANRSAEERSVELTVMAGDLTAYVNIRQRASLVSNCKVGFKETLVMTTSVAFKYDIDYNVSYFYAGYLSANAAGWTDEKIINTLMNEDRFDPNSSEDTGLQGFGGMQSDTDYYLCAVGFNAKGEQGELTKQLIRTQKQRNNVPLITVTNARYDSSSWYWVTNPNSYTFKYYMIGIDGIYATYFSYFFTEAEIGWLIRDMIDSGDLEAIARDGNWNMDREPDATALFIATWGINTDGTFSPVINRFYASIDSSKLNSKSDDNKSVKSSGHSDSLISEIKKSIKIIGYN